MNKVNFKCWSDTVRTEGNGSRLHAIRTIFCHTADSKERAEIVETLQKIAQEHFKDTIQTQHIAEVKAFLEACADDSMSRNNRQQLAGELLDMFNGDSK